MKTRQRDRGAPEPQAPWNEVRPRLWQGGHFWASPDGEVQTTVVGTEFDLVISLFTRPGHGPHPGVDHLTVRSQTARSRLSNSTRSNSWPSRQLRPYGMTAPFSCAATPATTAPASSSHRP